MAQKVLVDTDILSYYLKGSPDVVQAFDDYESKEGAVLISRITVIEILGGFRAKNASRQESDFKQFLKTRQVLELDEKSGEIAADIFAHLYKTGRHSGNYDIIIAATALANGLALCTNNTKDYQHIPGLSLLNWRKP